MGLEGFRFLKKKISFAGIDVAKGDIVGVTDSSKSAYFVGTVKSITPIRKFSDGSLIYVAEILSVKETTNNVSVVESRFIRNNDLSLHVRRE